MNEVVSIESISHPEITGNFIDWKLPIEEHGWRYAHNGIRADLKDLLIAVNGILGALKDGKYQPWMGQDFQFFCKFCNEWIHEHHYIEDEIWFPVMKTKLAIPDKFSEEHKTLVKIQDTLDEKLTTISKFNSGDYSSLPALFEEIKTLLSQIESFIEPHLVEEETIWLPIMLQTFSKSETNKPEKKMVASFKWFALPHMYRAIATKEQRERHMKTVLGIPGFVVNYILAGNFKKYDRMYRRKIDALKDFSLHEQYVKEDSKGGCIIS